MSLRTDPYQNHLPAGVTCCGWGICQVCGAGCSTHLQRGETTCAGGMCHTGCTFEATVYAQREEKYKWAVCAHCSKRGVDALPERRSAIEGRFSVETARPM